MLALNWFSRDSNNQNYQLFGVDLSHPHFHDLEGVYIIWRAYGIIPQAVYVGQGVVKNRLYAIVIILISCSTIQKQSRCMSHGQKCPGTIERV